MTTAPAPVLHPIPLWDATALGTIIASLVGAVPSTAAFLALIWYALQIYESQTFRSLFRRGR